MGSPAVLKSPVADYINGINDADLDLILSSLKPDAEIIDDGKSYTGDSIKQFIEHGVLAPKGHMHVLSVESSDSKAEVLVHTKMDGEYTSYGIHEPFDLFLAFTLSDGKVQRLIQGDVDSTKDTIRTVYAACGNAADPLSSIRIEKRNAPVAEQGYVGVKMQAVGLNFHDIFTLQGLGMHEIRFPMILGNEGSGVLDDGTPVSLYPNLGDVDFKGDETIDPSRHVLGEKVQGTLAEYVYVPRRNAVPRPEGLDANSASVMGIAWLTAYRMIFTKANLRAGQTVLVQGSSGGKSLMTSGLEDLTSPATGVTTALIQLASAAGYRVWTTGRSAEKRALATKLGAESTFEPLADLPRKVDAVFDVSGSATINHSIKSVKPGGAVVICGIHSDSGKTTVPIDLFPILVNQLNVTGVYTGTREEFVDLLSFVSAKGIKPYIGKVLPLEKAEEGFRDIFEGRTQGKIVITI